MLTKDQFMKLLNKRAITKPGAARSMARARRNVTIPGLLHALAEKEKQSADTEVSDTIADSEPTATLQAIEPVMWRPELDRDLYAVDVSEKSVPDSAETSTDVTVESETSTDTTTKKRTRRSSRKSKVDATADTDDTTSTEAEQ